MDPAADLAVDAALLLINLAESKIKMQNGGDGRGDAAFPPDGSRPDVSVGPEPLARLPPTPPAALHSTLDSALTSPPGLNETIRMDDAWGPYIRVLPDLGLSVLDWSPEEVRTSRKACLLIN